MIKLPEYFSNEWHLAALSGDVKPGKVIARTVIGTPITLFRAGTELGALVDRCPHRNYPLSKGRLVDGTLECPYHGWRFRADGACASVPGCSLASLCEKDIGYLKAQKVHVTEKHGAIFVCLGTPATPAPELPPLIGDENFDHFWWKQGVWKGTAFDAIENVLDPFHTKFIHHGFIRRRDKHIPVELQVNSYERSIEMIIRQTQPDLGLMSRALEHGGRSYSVTRYYAPTTVQARWEAPEKLTLCVTAFFTPEGQDSFRPFACFTSPKGMAPAWLKQALIRLFLFPVIEQDRRALAAQHAVATAFHAPRYTHGPGDLLGSRVYKLYMNKSLEPGQDAPVSAEL